MVNSVGAGSLGAQAGLLPNDQFISINGGVVDSIDALKALSSTEQLACKIRRGEQELELTIRKPSADAKLGLVPKHRTNPAGVLAIADALRANGALTKVLALLSGTCAREALPQLTRASCAVRGAEPHWQQDPRRGRSRDRRRPA